MLWWAAALVVWMISAASIFYVMADVFRGKTSGVSPKLYPAYAFHGVTAVLALWLVAQALTA